MENVSSSCLALVALCCASFPFFLTHCGVMSCVFALSVVGSCVTDFTTSHVWLKSKSHPHRFARVHGKFSKLWMTELGSEVAGGGKDAQQTQPKTKNPIVRTGSVSTWHTNHPIFNRH